MNFKLNSYATSAVNGHYETSYGKICGIVSAKIFYPLR